MQCPRKIIQTQASPVNKREKGENNLKIFTKRYGKFMKYVV